VPGRIDAENAVPAEMRAGAIVLFHGNMPHFTPPNNSDRRRRALQYHFRSAENSTVSREQYYEIFREADGSPASCAAATQNRV
jgi:phytanoyl-CoA hydroxylase